MDIKERFSAVRTAISETQTDVMNLLYLLDECDVNTVNDELFDELYANLTEASNYIGNAWDKVRDAEKEFARKAVNE